MRANLNDLIDKAEDPQKLLRQLVLDMENQLMQVKTQVAIAIADQHLLEKKRKEHMDSAAEWRSKAELAVKKGHDDLARAALERSLSQDQIAKGFSQQLEDQQAEADTLRTALRKSTRSCERSALPAQPQDGSYHYTDAREQRSAAQDHGQHHVRPGPQGNTNSDFLGSLSHHVSQHTKDTDCG